MAKLGLLILFIGVSFLLKYTAARVTLPIELRLAGIVLADLALLAWGWRIRLRRPAISLPVQGAALAVLMLVTFGAFRVYQLIPGGLAFALLLVLTLFTCVLAVLQNAMWLAIFGIAGGFATPILASSGGGLQFSETNIVLPALLGVYRAAPARQSGASLAARRFEPIVNTTFYRTTQDGNTRSSGDLDVVPWHAPQWVLRTATPATVQPVLRLSWQP